MLWVIWDILVPLAVAFLAGMLIGWLCWRWRRMKMTSDELAAIRRSSARYKSDADSLRGLNADLAERLRTANGASESTTLKDLAAANKKINKLREQLKQANREQARNQHGSGENTGIKSRVSAKRLHGAAHNRVRDLEAQLSVARQKIQTLENTANQPVRYGENTAKKPQMRQRIDSEFFEEEIAARDKMIVTLQHSLEQYGEQPDTTAMMAEIELREERIVALESQLKDTQIH